MSGIHKFNKISMVVSLLVASTSWVHAMDPDDTELARAIQLSLAPVQEVQKHLPHGYVYFSGSDTDLAACIAAQQELGAQATTHHRVEKKPSRPVNSDLGIDTNDLTEAEVWALIQAHDDSQQTAQAARNNPFISSQEKDLTSAEWESIKQKAFEAEKASQTIWTRDPGRQVPENHPQYRLRAENMPDSHKNGAHANAQTQGLGGFIQNLERAPDRDEQWQNRAKKNEKQMEKMKVVPAAPKPTQAALDAQNVLQQLNGLKKKDPSANLPVHQPLPQPKEKQEPTSVNAIATQFGGQGGFKKPAEKK